MADAFSPVATDIGSGFWRYDGKMSGTPIRLQIRFCGKMITPQLRYDVSVYSPGCTISAPSVCFESVLGVGYGTWDYTWRDSRKECPPELSSYSGLHSVFGRNREPTFESHRFLHDSLSSGRCAHETVRIRRGRGGNY
jgi:hypothetical protein